MGGFYQGLSEELSLWVRQAAWLSAPLKNDKKDRSRAQIAREKGDELPQMAWNPAPYLTDWLFEIGPTSGDHTLSWSEMAAWEKNTGIRLLPFEAKILRRLSNSYANERLAAREPDYPMPVKLDHEHIEAGRDAVAAKVEALFG